MTTWSLTFIEEKRSDFDSRSSVAWYCCTTSWLGTRGGRGLISFTIGFVASPFLSCNPLVVLLLPLCTLGPPPTAAKEPKPPPPPPTVAKPPPPPPPPTVAKPPPPPNPGAPPPNGAVGVVPPSEAEITAGVVKSEGGIDLATAELFGFDRS